MQSVTGQPIHEYCNAPPARWPRLAWAASLLGLFPAAYAFRPFILRDALPICPFRCATGKPCPLCGLTRAFASATHGDFHAAFDFNPLWPIFSAVAILFSVLLAIDVFAGTALAVRLGRAASRSWLGLLGLLVAFG